LASLALAAAAHAAPVLLASGSISSPTDSSGLTYAMESGSPENMLGGIGSGLSWAGGTTFLSIPDRGPNAIPYAGGTAVDNTQSYIARFQTLDLGLTNSVGPGGLPMTLNPVLNQTTLLYSPTALTYGNTAGLASGTPPVNDATHSYFTGRSDGFSDLTGSALSLNPDFARLDPEGIRVSNDGNYVFISDEYGPYVYEFDRATGERVKTFTLPANLGIDSLSALGANEISGNTAGRVANKGMEGLAITPDGKTLVGFMQSPLIQDGGDGGTANRIVTIDIATGDTHEYAYNNAIGGKAFNSSEIVALNDHQFLVLERDGKGLGDGSTAKVKQIYAVDLAGASDVSAMSGQAALLAQAPSKTLFLDMESALKSFVGGDNNIPAKLEGMAFGSDVVSGGVNYHTLYVANDNDFLPGDPAHPSNPYPNLFYVFGFTDADVASMNLDAYQGQQVVPEPQSLALFGMGFMLLAIVARRKAKRA
jgi:hypothetical protein